MDLADEIKAGNLVRALIREGKVGAVHDVCDGGLLVAIAEMALAGGIGVQLFPYEGKLPAHAAWFGEDQGRYVLEAAPELAEEIIERARLLALPARVVGRVGGDALALKGEAPLPPRPNCGGRTRAGCRRTWPLDRSVNVLDVRPGLRSSQTHEISLRLGKLRGPNPGLPAGVRSALGLARCLLGLRGGSRRHLSKRTTEGVGVLAGAVIARRVNEPLALGARVLGWLALCHGASRWPASLGDLPPDERDRVVRRATFQFNIVCGVGELLPVR